jgi:hypothetical protein
LRALAAVVDQARRQGIRVLLCDLTAATRYRIAASPLGASFAPGELELSFDDALFAIGPTGEMPARTSAG